MAGLPLLARLPFRLARRQGDTPELQLAQQGLVGRRGEPLRQGLGNLATDAENGGDRFRRLEGCWGELRSAGEGLGQGLGVDFAHVVDTQAIELAMPGLGLGGGQGIHQVLGRFLPQALQAG